MKQPLPTKLIIRVFTAGSNKCRWCWPSFFWLTSTARDGSRRFDQMEKDSCHGSVWEKNLCNLCFERCQNRSSKSVSHRTKRSLFLLSKISASWSFHRCASSTNCLPLYKMDTQARSSYVVGVSRENVGRYTGTRAQRQAERDPSGLIDGGHVDDAYVGVQKILFPHRF